MSSSEKAYAALGVPPPRRTFLDRGGRSGSAATARGVTAAAGAPPPLPQSVASPLTSGVDAGLTGADASKAMLLAAHKVELEDMLNESLALLRSVYRAKFVFGDHLRYVDPSYSGDTVNQFQLSTPPIFDPAFAGNAQTAPSANAGARGNALGALAEDDAASASVRDKLRTAEELIKKLYRRNQQLEVETRHLRAEVTHHERLSGLGRSGSHNLCFVDGHIPNDHPLYSRKLKRRCRSGPPTRTLLRTAVGGYGLTFPPRGQQVPDDAPREEPLPIQQLKRRVHQLTEALVTVQHENEQLVAEKSQRLSLRDALLKSYLAERDQQLAALHTALQDLVAKVNNPMRMARARQPAAGVSPMVATNNVVREINAKLAAQVASLTDEIVAKAAAAMPPSAAVAFSEGQLGSPRRPGTADTHTGSVVQQPHPPGSKPAATASVVDSTIGARRRELTKRVRAVVETLPTQKRKQLLLILSELKQLYEALAASNRSLLAAFEDHKARSSAEAVRAKLQVAMLRDQLRALGVREDDEQALVDGAAAGGEAAGGGHGTLNDP